MFLFIAKQLPRPCSFVLLCPGCGPDTWHQVRPGTPSPSDTMENNLHLQPGLFPLDNSSTDKKSSFILNLYVSYEWEVEEFLNQGNFFLCINRNVLGIVFKPQTDTEVETAFNSQNDKPNFPALVSMTEVNSAEVCLCSNVQFGLLFHIWSQVVEIAKMKYIQ